MMVMVMVIDDATLLEFLQVGDRNVSEEFGSNYTMKES